MKKIVTSFIMLLFLVGCGVTKMQVVDEGGRQYPNPHYILKTTNKKFATLFYYTAYSTEKDIDGYEVPIPNYLNMHENHSFSLRKYQNVFLSIEVRNSTKQRYELWERSVYKDRDGSEISRGKRIAFSNREYRTFNFNLPYSKEYKKVRYGIYMTNGNGDIILSFGELQYSIH